MSELLVSNQETFPSLEEIHRLIDLGYEIDSFGRPIHPWAETLLATTGGNLATGKGVLWNWGPNYTADPIVITDEPRCRILLIKRSDNGMLALPGGFVNSGEGSYTSALRELQEETGLMSVSGGEIIYQGPVADPRTTLNAWPETSAYLFTVPDARPVKAGDDATNADWYDVDNLPQELYGSHAMLIEAALDKRFPERQLNRLLMVPESDRTTTILQVGHMAYNHFVTEYNGDSIFVKQHDASKFDDPEREAHSRAYLAKESWMYRYLTSHNFKSIPARNTLVGDTLLAMDNLSEKAGWKWRLPQAVADNYIQDILNSLNNLQVVQLPDDLPFHNGIKPSYETFWSEGWDSIDDETAALIISKVKSFSEKWNGEWRTSAECLIEAFDDIRKNAALQSHTPPLFTAHNDARQSNIAWHPKYGVRIVDWSWADKAPRNADTTMFLIDIAKSGHNVSAYMKYFNPDYAKTLIGFWLAHSIWETLDGSTTVREHQVASACAALELIGSK